MMAKNISNVQKFEDDLRKKILPQAKKEIRKVNEKFTSKNKQLKNVEEKDWDFSFYRNKYHLDESRTEKTDDKTLR